MNLQIINGCTVTDPGLPTARTGPGRRYCLYDGTCDGFCCCQRLFVHYCDLIHALQRLIRRQSQRKKCMPILLMKAFCDGLLTLFREGVRVVCYIENYIVPSPICL